MVKIIKALVKKISKGRVSLVNVTEDQLKKRAEIKEIEEILLNSENQIECPLIHHFAHESYGRELHIPKGTLLVGAINRYATLNVLAKGDISVFTEDGLKRVKAPYVVVSKAGTKRAGYAHEDCVWVTAHATTETDTDQLLKDITVEDYSGMDFLTQKHFDEIEKIKAKEAGLCQQ